MEMGGKVKGREEDLIGIYNKQLLDAITDCFLTQFYIIIFKPKIYRFKFVNLCITYYTFFNLLKPISSKAQTMQYLS